MMKRFAFAVCGAVLVAASLHAQQPAAPAAPAAQQPQVYMLGNPLGLPINPDAEGHLQSDVVERQGLRRDLFRRELLVPIRIAV